MGVDTELVEHATRQIIKLLCFVALVVAVLIGTAAFIGGYYIGQQESEATHDQ